MNNVAFGLFISFIAWVIADQFNLSAGMSILLLAAIWVGLYILADSHENSKPCSSCAETIKLNAKICKHCGAEQE